MKTDGDETTNHKENEMTKTMKDNGFCSITITAIKASIGRWYADHGQDCPPLDCWSYDSLCEIHNSLYHRDPPA